MDNCESKSIIGSLPIVVKEQRVDGRGQVYYNTCLRYTLRGFERNSHTYIQSKLIKNKLYSISAIDNNHNELVSKMNP